MRGHSARVPAQPAQAGTGPRSISDSRIRFRRPRLARSQPALLRTSRRRLRPRRQPRRQRQEEAVHRYIEEQLAPEHIDDSALDHAIRRIETLSRAARRIVRVQREGPAGRHDARRPPARRLVEAAALRKDGPLLDRSLQYRFIQRRLPVAQGRRRPRRDPPPRAGQLSRPAARLRAEPRDALVPRRPRQSQAERTPTSRTKTTRANCWNCTRSASTAATRSAT